MNGQWREFSIPVANTQFHSIYLPQYACGYELDATALILAATERCSSTWGANWGYFSILLAVRPGFSGPWWRSNPAMLPFTTCRTWCIRLGLQQVVQCLNCATASTAAQRQLVMPDGMHSGLAMLADWAGGETVCAVALDDVDLPAPRLDESRRGKSGIRNAARCDYDSERSATVHYH